MYIGSDGSSLPDLLMCLDNLVSSCDGRFSRSILCDVFVVDCVMIESSGIVCTSRDTVSTG